MKALVISMVASAALYSVMFVPASAMPMTNLPAAASDLALGQSVRYSHRYHRYRLHRPSGYYGYGPSYYGYGSSYYGYGPSSPYYP
jgi:hypothetical protein